MSEAEETERTTPPAESAEAPATAPARRWPWFLLLLVLGLLAAAGWLGWREYQRIEHGRAELADWRQRAQQLADRIDAVEQSLEATRRNQRALGERLDAATSTNSLLRNELLAIAERAGQLEESVARLAEQRLRGELLLKLDEAEFLLLMGEERLRLFGDVEATRQAFQLTDGVLASVEDPLAAALRETLAVELAALQAVPANGPRRARAELDAAAALVAGLTEDARREAAQPLDTDAPRLLQLLSRLVTVRRVGDDEALVDPVLRDAVRGVLMLDLAIARAAAERRDETALQAAVLRAEGRVRRLYEPTEPEVARILQRLAMAAQVELAPELPNLGATLRELRAIRAARAIPPPAAAPPRTDAPAPAADGGR